MRRKRKHKHEEKGGKENAVVKQEKKREKDIKKYNKTTHDGKRTGTEISHKNNKQTKKHIYRKKET